MSRKILETMIRQTIQAGPGPVVSFTWHGGEPTLAGLDFYREVIELEKQYLPPGWQVWNNLQTNGLLLDEAWCRFLKENQFDVGLSIDGSRRIHDKNRQDAGGAGTWDCVVQAAKRLKSVGIEPDLLCTVNADSLREPLEVYGALRELETGWIQFIPIVVPGPDNRLSPESVTPEGYGDFLCTVFDEWAAHDLGCLDVQLFAEMARVMVGGTAGVCTMTPVCGRVLVVEADGSVYSCDHFVDGAHRLGSVKTGDIGDFVESRKQTSFGNAKRDALTAECRHCRWLRWCAGGCPKDRFGRSQEGEPGHSYLCPGLKKFYSHVEEPMREMLRLSRRGCTPEEIKEKLKKG